jgi:glycosyltransferase involved in cell wall biosynthesis
MKILIISNYFPPFYKGGYELSCKETCDYLLVNNEVYILTGDYQAEIGSKIPSSLSSGDVTRTLRYIDYQNGGYKQKLGVERYNYKQTEVMIQRTKPDIVYLWNQQGISLSPLFAVQASKTPVVFDFGDFWYRVYLRDALSDKIKRFSKKILPFAVSGKPVWNNLITVSNWMSQELKAELHPERITVIPRGIDPEKISQPRKDVTNLKLMFSGRIDKMKGLHICLEALNSIRDFPFEFNIFGSGDEEYLKFCQQLAKKYDLTESVYFKGVSEDIFREYATHHIVLMPTLGTETFGRVVIEAMAHEAIVIASNSYGPAEIIDSGKDGFLITPGSASEMAEIITMLKGNVDKMKSIAKNAKLKVIEKYNLNIVNKLREKVLQEEVMNHA